MGHEESNRARRELILTAAEKLVLHYGLTKTTVADIAREAQIGVGTVYLEFGSKDDIVTALAAQRYEAVCTKLQQAIGAPVAYAERLQRFFEVRAAAFLHVAEHGQHAADMLGLSCEALSRANQTFRAREVALLVELLGAACVAGDFVVRDVPLTARALLGAYASFAPPTLFCARRDDDHKALLAATHALVLHGLCRGPP